MGTLKKAIKIVKEIAKSGDIAAILGAQKTLPENEFKEWMKNYLQNKNLLKKDKENDNTTQ